MGLGAALLAGCTQQDGRAYPTDVDIARATRMWTDPWLAPTASTTARPQGPAPGVTRAVAGRRYTTTTAPRVIVAAEVQVALSRGWTLTDALCEDGDAGSVGAVTAYLVTGGDDLDTAAIARVSAAPTATGDTVAPTPSASGTGLAHPVEVIVSAAVPHHLDATWPTAPAVDPGRTCLGSGPNGTAPPQLPSSPLISSGSSVPPAEVRPWSDDAVPAALAGALSGARADPVLSSMGVVLSRPTWTGGTTPRVLPYASSTRTGTSSMLTDAVATATAAGWRLTYAACLGGPAPTLAELRRTLTDSTSLTLRLTQVPDAQARDRATLTAAAIVTGPHWWGPEPEQPAPVQTPCWALRGPARTSQVPLIDGTPWFGPTTIWPLQATAG